MKRTIVPFDMKTSMVLISALLLYSNGFSQTSKSMKIFSLEECSFNGTKYEQAEYLLRTVKPMAIIEKDKQVIPELMGKLLNDLFLQFRLNDWVNTLRIALLSRKKWEVI